MGTNQRHRSRYGKILQLILTFFSKLGLDEYFIEMNQLVIFLDIKLSMKSPLAVADVILELAAHAGGVEKATHETHSGEVETGIKTKKCVNKDFNILFCTSWR